MNPDVKSLQYVKTELDTAIVEMASGDLLAARERLALIVAILDKVTYPNG
jgi:hypothetical protein